MLKIRNKNGFARDNNSLLTKYVTKQIIPKRVTYMKQKKHPVPSSLQDQLQMLFGWSTKIGRSKYLTDSQFKQTAMRVLRELEKYLSANVHSDFSHPEELRLALKSAQGNDNPEYWWPRVFEGLVRLSLLLMGDLPSHEQHTGGRPSKDYYSLKRHRSVCWTQTNLQHIRMLYTAEYKLSKKIWRFQKEFAESSDSDNIDLITWLRKNYPLDYAKVY